MSQTNAEVPRTLLFEDVLPKTGWGLYYKFMVGMACATSFMHGSAFLSLPFSIPLSTCEHAVTQKILLTLHTGFCLGRSIGGLVLNSLSDVYGRKRFLSYSLAIIFLSSFTAAFAYNYYVITFSAFILASGLESNFCVLRIHLAEILPKNRRGYYLALCDVFWTLGYISLSIFAILMKTPSVIETRAMDMRLTTWRMIFAICGGLSIILACTTALLEESPRYFLHVKKHYLALLTLKQFYAINRSSYGETFDVKEADLRNIVQDDLSVYPEPEGFVNIFERVATLIFKSARSLIAGPFLASTAILLIVKTSLTMLGPLEVNIWLAKRLETNSTVLEGIDFVYLDGMRNLSMCNLLEENRTLYYLYFALASNYLLGKIFVMLSIDTCGRRVNCVIGMLTCAACFFAYPYLRYFTAKIVVSSALMVFYSIATTTLSIVNVESYPTSLRGTSWGFVSFLGIFLSIFVVRYYYLIQEYFLFGLGSLFFGGAVASYFLRDLSGKPMVE